MKIDVNSDYGGASYLEHLIRTINPHLTDDDSILFSEDDVVDHESFDGRYDHTQKYNTTLNAVISNWKLGVRYKHKFHYNRIHIPTQYQKIQEALELKEQLHPGYKKRFGFMTHQFRGETFGLSVRQTYYGVTSFFGRTDYHHRNVKNLLTKFLALNPNHYDLVFTPESLADYEQINNEINYKKPEIILDYQHGDDPDCIFTLSYYVVPKSKFLFYKQDRMEDELKITMKYFKPY